MTSLAIHTLFARWQKIPAFARRAHRFSNTSLVLKRSRAKGGEWSSGMTYKRGLSFEIILRVGTNDADAHSVLLHEMAHVVCRWGYGRAHSDEWRDVFSRALVEVGAMMKGHKGVTMKYFDGVGWGLFTEMLKEQVA